MFIKGKCTIQQILLRESKQFITLKRKFILYRAIKKEFIELNEWMVELNKFNLNESMF